MRETTAQQPWTDSAECDALEPVLAEALGGLRNHMPAPCPICAHESVHVYFHAREGGRMGGSWVWCSSCRCFSHGSIRTPAWWANLEGVELANLTAAPEVLEPLAARIDAHWNRLQRAMKEGVLPPCRAPSVTGAGGHVSAPGRRGTTFTFRPTHLPLVLNIHMTITDMVAP